jgi:hypothetical protein
VVLILGFVGTFRTYLWDETPCTIIESRRVEPGIEKDPKDGKGGPFVIAYRYLANGQEQVSRQFSNGITESREESAIERLLLEYPVNSTASCYVNPSKPQEAVLRRGPLWVFAFIFIPLIFVAVGVGGIIRLWTADKQRANTIARKAARMGTNAGGYIFGSIFALVGAGLLYGLTIHPALRVIEARSWEEVPCKILGSKVGAHSGKHGSTYSVDVTYSYRVNGREYRSDRYQFLGGSSSGYNGKAAIVNRYPVGSTSICYVNPSDPTDAVINRSFHAAMLFGLVGLIFLLVGLGVLFGTLRSKGPRSLKASTIPSLPTPGGAPSLATTSALIAGAPIGPVELESASTPIGRFLGGTFLALFWNGITGVFVGMAVNSWGKKKPEIFLSIFMIPFVLVGIGLIAFVFHSLLNLLNPRIRLTVGSQSIPLGGKLDVRWGFRGRSSRIRHLRIYLEGSEKARYTRGTDTRVDTRVFARLPVKDTMDSRQIAEGQAQLLIPKDSMHTFTAAHNEIIWSLKVHGDVPRFPDVSDEFPIAILPHG